MCLLEGTNVSEGRGTLKPFISFGAPWINPNELLAELNKYNLSGLKFTQTSFTPKNILGQAINPKYKGQRCYGLEIEITNFDFVQPIQAAMLIIKTIKSLYPEQFEFNSTNYIDKLYGNDQFRKIYVDYDSLDTVFLNWDVLNSNFNNLRKKYLLYK